jgi:hypothetical protein
MARICDGCNERDDVSKLARVTMTLATGDVKGEPKSFDLCNPCEVRLEEMADPTTWPRKKTRKPRKGT